MAYAKLGVKDLSKLVCSTNKVEFGIVQMVALET